MVIFHSYVSLPEGISSEDSLQNVLVSGLARFVHLMQSVLAKKARWLYRY